MIIALLQIMLVLAVLAPPFVLLLQAKKHRMTKREKLKKGEKRKRWFLK